MLSQAPERKILRRMNYISDQKGILRRYIREQGLWNSHLQNAGSFIIHVLQNHPVNHIVLLGSGWLLDFPIEKILPLVQKITLVDIYFPQEILKKAESMKGVECVAADITGGYIGTIYDSLRKLRSDFTIPDTIKSPYIEPEKGKLLISLNIMNQLDILLVDYIKSKIIISEEQILEFRKRLQEDHKKLLFDHPYILITDCHELLINSTGNILEDRELIFTELPSGDIFEEWEWLFDSHQLYNADADTVMKVKAVFSNGAGI